MNKFKKVVAWVSVIFGVFFILNSATDIQLGFGIVLITNGLMEI